MSTTIKLRRSSVPGRVPTNAQLEFGEVAINTADGKIFIKSGNTSFEQVLEFSPHPDDLLALIKTVDGTGSGLDADLLDGESGAYYLDYNNFTNVPPATLDLTLSGKVTGTAFSNTGVMTLITELANTGVTPGTYGSSSQIPVLTVDEDGRITLATTSSVGGVDSFGWTIANNTLTIATSDGTNYNATINEFADLTVEDLTANSVTINYHSFGALDVSGDASANNLVVANDLTVGGTVDGRDVAADGTKLDGIEPGATADQTPSELLTAIKTVDGTTSGLDSDLLDGQEGSYYLDYNNFTNVPPATLDLTLSGKVTGTAFSNTGVMVLTTELANTGVTPGSYGTSSQIPVLTVDEDGRITAASTTAVAGVDDFTWSSANSTLNLATGDGTTYAVTVDTFDEITVTGDISANNIVVSGLVDGRDVAADGTKLDGIEPGATADQTAADIRALGFFDVTNDGDTSGLDADLLDGLHASDILAQAASSAGDQIGNGLVTITANNGLIGSGDFNLNDFSNTTISISHADTSTQSSVDNSDGNVIQDIAVDDYGHITSIGSVDLDGRYYTETETDTLLNGKADKTIQIIAGDALTGGGTLGANITINHDDTSAQANLTLSTTEFVSGVDFDDYGHVINFTKETRNYLTQAAGDLRYVNVTGDTMTGDLTVSGSDIIMDQHKLVSIEATTTSIFPTNIFSFALADYGSAEIIITAKDGNDKHITKLLVIHDGTDVYATEFATVATGSELATYDVFIVTGAVILSASAASSNTTTYKVVATLIDV